MDKKSGDATTTSVASVTRFKRLSESLQDEKTEESREQEDCDAMTRKIKYVVDFFLCTHITMQLFFLFKTATLFSSRS